MIRDLFEGWHIVIVLLVLVVVFGSKRLPDITRSVGRSMRIFKSEVSGLRDDDDKKPAGPTEPLTGKVVDEPPAARSESARPESPAASDERR
jgi:sec-independent protein translocase protein TatA